MAPCGIADDHDDDTRFARHSSSLGSTDGLGLRRGLRADARDLGEAPSPRQLAARSSHPSHSFAHKMTHLTQKFGRPNFCVKSTISKASKGVGERKLFSDARPFVALSRPSPRAERVCFRPGVEPPFRSGSIRILVRPSTVRAPAEPFARPGSCCVLNRDGCLRPTWGSSRKSSSPDRARRRGLACGSPLPRASRGRRRASSTRARLRT